MLNPSGHMYGMPDGGDYADRYENVHNSYNDLEAVRNYDNFLNNTLGAERSGEIAQNMVNQYVETGELKYYLGTALFSTWTPETADKLLGTLGFEGVLSFMGAAGKALYSAPKVVIGHYPDYVDVGKKMNAKLFDLKDEVWKNMEKVFPDEIWMENRKFLDSIMRKGDDVILATPPNQIRANSYLEKEMHYLLENGYNVRTK